MALEVSVHDRVVLLLWAFHEIVPYGRNVCWNKHHHFISQGTKQEKNMAVVPECPLRALHTPQ